jgi:hypothetical protein
MEHEIYEMRFEVQSKHSQNMQEAGVPTLNESAQNTYCAHAGRVDSLPEDVNQMPSKSWPNATPACF